MIEPIKIDALLAELREEIQKLTVTCRNCGRRIRRVDGTWIHWDPLGESKDYSNCHGKGTASAKP